MTELIGKKIGVFDSGLGGLSILSQIVKRLPSLHYDYVMDADNFPYSDKSEQVVLSSVLDVCSRFFKVSKFDALVVACNTASTIALDRLRQTLPCPVIGVVPAIKPAAALTQTNHILALMTERAAQQPYVFELIKSFASHCKVDVVGSSKLVRIAEAKVRGHVIDLNDVRDCLSPLIHSPSIDTVVLGCTHFPLLLDEFKACLTGREIRFVDSGEALARRVLDVLTTQHVCEDSARISSANTGYCNGRIRDLWPGEVSPYVKALGLSQWKELS